MSKIDLVKMSSKGQLVVPQDIRESIDMKPGERFVAFAIDDGVVFKKVKIPDFEKLAKDVESQFKKNKVTRSDLKEALKWSRR
jgi:AbrB family looped-hinge helix DNA binding protein